MQMPCKRATSLHRGPAGKPGGVLFAGTFERNAYLGSFVEPGRH